MAARGVGKIPDRGFCIGGGGRRPWGGPLIGSYEACFLKKADARKAAQLLADASSGTIDLVQVQNRGQDRFIIEQIEPRSRQPVFGRKTPRGTYWMVRWSPSHDVVMVRAKTKVEAIEKAWPRKKASEQISTVERWAGPLPEEYPVVR